MKTEAMQIGHDSSVFLYACHRKELMHHPQDLGEWVCPYVSAIAFRRETPHQCVSIFVFALSIFEFITKLHLIRGNLVW